jgi:hypothetical protein
MSHGRSSDFTGSHLLALTSSRLRFQCRLLHMGFRTCLPLRGSSGLSPDSLFRTPVLGMTME